MIDWTAWLRARRELLEQVKAQVTLRLGPTPKALLNYAEAIERDYRRAWRPAPMRELDQALARATVVLGADFHAFAQAQRAHVRLLRALKRKDVVLALECVREEDEPDIEKYLRGDLSEEGLRRRIKWDAHWGFPWNHYQALFTLARERGFKIKGLGRPDLGSLRARDSAMAKRVAHFVGSHPHALVYVVIGEWHLGSPHLPSQLRKRGINDPVVVLQDSERLYFRQAKTRREAGLLRSGKNKFCLMVSPPWMKWQSYLIHLEASHDYELEGEVDFTDHVRGLVEILERDLGVHTDKSRIQVFGNGALKALKRLQAGVGRELGASALYHVRHDLSFYLPERDWFYLSRPTINHASTLAAQFVHAHLSDRRRSLWRGRTDFAALIWVEAIGFFLSKWINPKRKADTLEGLELQLAGRYPRDRGQEALLLALDQRLTEVLWTRTGRWRPPRYRPKHAPVYFEAARICGSMLGQRLFARVRTIRLPRLMRYLKIEVGGAEFEDVYRQLLREIEGEK